MQRLPSSPHPATRSDASVHIAYSTLSEYFDAVAAEAAGSPEHDVLFRTAEAAAGARAVPPSTVTAIAPFPILRPDGGWADGGVDWYPYADNANSWCVRLAMMRARLARR